ncbi:MAG: heterodisulfide reductase-related iron-sulfur binding cluster [Pseudomonadota bacterium]
MAEGSLEAPIRHPIPWTDPDWTDPVKLDAEMRRVFDICHGCRRCFNLCDSFPRLFDLIDNSKTGELDSVKSEDFAPVVEACTLCDMCFMTKCPYVPPHPFDLDFPHLMLRYRAAQEKHNAPKKPAEHRQKELAKTDRNGKLAELVAPLANWGADVKNGFGRALLSAVMEVDPHAVLPKYHSRTLTDRARVQDALNEANANQTAPGYGRKAVIFATCFGQYNNPQIGEAARRVLAHMGVDTVVAYPGCCGMPQLEQAELAHVANQARVVSSALMPYIDEGRDVITLIASCSLMLKFEWPLVLPDDQTVKRLSEATRDVDEYIVNIAKENGLPPGLKAVDGAVALHHACHARAQNMGAKAQEMLKLIPDQGVSLVERCSGHGGTFGVMKGTHEIAMKVGKPAARAVKQSAAKYVASDCPLAAKHIAQGVAAQGGPTPINLHPVEIFARAYGLIED